MKLEIAEGDYEGQIDRIVVNRQGIIVRHGYGIMKYLNGSTYTGNWHKDKR